MVECCILFVAESMGLFLIWPKLMAKRAGFHNRALLKDNPHLKKCYEAWRWTVPIAFALTTIVMITNYSAWIEIVEEPLVFNATVFFVTLIISTLIGEVIGEYYRYLKGIRWHKRFQQSRHF
ncbi:hypothetical protein K1X84_02735 [bacterium]|nr:hypothetical protein [bacterium]